MKKVICAIGALVGLASAQGQGDGISKYTRGQSDPRACLKFFEDILGATESPDSCDEGVCECATQGRSQFGESSGLGYQGPPPGPSGESFGLHAINCTYHPYGEHGLAWTEQQISTDLGDFSKLSQHMDSHVGILTEDLSKYLTKLESSEYKHLRLQYESEGTTYYSVLAEACGGYFIEILSTTNPSLHDTSDFVKSKEPRFDFTGFDFSAVTADKVVKVSRATTKLDEMIAFYTETIGGTVVSNGTSDDGTKWAIVKLTHADAQLHFVDRPAAADAKFTVADLETMVNSVHDQYIKSVNCGFDQYADHHWAYDSMSNDITLSKVSKKLEEGGHKFRWFEIPGNIHQIYAFDPSGWTLQLDLSPGWEVPSKCATYAASCKSDDGCYGQGLCDNLEAGHFVYDNLNDYRFFLQ